MKPPINELDSRPDELEDLLLVICHLLPEGFIVSNSSDSHDLLSTRDLQFIARAPRKNLSQLMLVGSGRCAQIPRLSEKKMSSSTKFHKTGSKSLFIIRSTHQHHTTSHVHHKQDRSRNLSCSRAKLKLTAQDTRYEKKEDEII